MNKIGPANGNDLQAALVLFFASGADFIKQFEKIQGLKMQDEKDFYKITQVDKGKTKIPGNQTLTGNAFVTMLNIFSKESFEMYVYMEDVKIRLFQMLAEAKDPDKEFSFPMFNIKLADPTAVPKEFARQDKGLLCCLA